MENTYLIIEINDNGKGIPAEKQKLIFNEQESDQSDNNWDGTGLGLPICAQLCLKIGASIR
jgi:signal transduction histidine kinase